MKVKILKLYTSLETLYILRTIKGVTLKSAACSFFFSFKLIYVHS